MPAYEEALALLRDHPDAVDFRPQPEDRIDRAERALGVRFPPTYRRFLRELGALDVGAEEIYGVVGDDFEDVRPPGAIGLTLDLRREGDIPDHLVVVYALGQGSYYALDLARADADGEPPVLGFTPGLSRYPDDFEVVASDFGHFLLETVRFELA